MPENPDTRLGSALAAGLNLGAMDFDLADLSVLVSIEARVPEAARRRENHSGGLWGLMLKWR
jgi:hypothetical protein